MPLTTCIEIDNSRASRNEFSGLSTVICLLSELFHV